MNPLKTVLVMAACAAGPSWATAAPQPFPWQREVSLREAAQSTALQGPLNPTDPGRPALSINDLKMHTVIWGPPDRITISVTKNNVWDRRLDDFPAPTLQEITEGAFSPANKDYVGVKEIDSSTFALVDIAGPASMAEKLSKDSDPLSAWLSERLDEKTKTSLAAFQASKPSYAQERAFLTNLVECFNTIIAGPSLFEEKRFQDVRLRPDTDGLRQGHPEGRELIRLNRLLLEDAYPGEIPRKPGSSLRPLDLGWLRKEGGSYDPYRYPMRYAFPCLKPVGQIILGIDPLAGTSAPRLTQNCANGVTRLPVANGSAKASLDYVLGMTRDTYAIRGTLTGISTPVWLRLYRHRDTTHLDYCLVSGIGYTFGSKE